MCHSINPPAFSFFSITFATLSPLLFHIHFRVRLPISPKSWDFAWNYLNSTDKIRKIWYLIALTFRKRRSWHLVPSFHGKWRGKQGQQCQTLFFGGSKITADGDYSHKIKRRLLLGRKVMTNLDSILKSRDITLPTKVCLVKAMVFPVIMCGCESWTVKKAEHWRIDSFELWC